MAEPYSDEELGGLVRNRAQRLMATVARLKGERDEARRLVQRLQKQIKAAIDTVELVEGDE